MQSKEILTLIETVHDEKRIAREDVFAAMETALAVAISRSQHKNMDIRVAIDRRSGDYEVYRRWQVVEDDLFESSDMQILLSDAQKRQDGIGSDDFLEESLPNSKLSRVSAFIAKQVIVQKIREYERAYIGKLYRDRPDKMLVGIVRREDRGGVTVELEDGVEGFIPREQMIPGENMRQGHRVKTYLFKIGENTQGHQIILSRIMPELLVELFKMEVPEMVQGALEILAVARDPGMRAKMTVRANAPGIDPIGACVGVRGSRVQAVSSELFGERVDVIVWSENFGEYVVNAMEPANVSSVVVDEDRKSIDIAVEEDQFAQAVGRNGQNVKLAKQLLGWDINVVTVAEAEGKKEKETADLIRVFREKLGVDEEFALILVQEGFSDIEEIAYCDVEELKKIQEFDPKVVVELHGRANDVLLQAAMDEDQSGVQGIVSSVLIDKELVDHIVVKLIEGGIRSRDDLGDLSTEDLTGIVDVDDSTAGRLIMKARDHWFQQK